MASMTSADIVRERVERKLAAGEVNLATEAGRERAQTLIDEVLADYRAELLSSSADLGL